jgi:hypothetical protein
MFLHSCSIFVCFRQKPNQQLMCSTRQRTPLMFVYLHRHMDFFDDLLRANADHTLEADSSASSDSDSYCDSGYCDSKDLHENCRSCSDNASALQPQSAKCNLLDIDNISRFPEKNISVSKLVPKPASVIVCDLNQPPRQKKRGGGGAQGPRQEVKRQQLQTQLRRSV